MTTSPAVAPGFVWAASPAGLVLRCVALEALADHVFTTRELAFLPSSLAKDYARLGLVLGVSEEQIARVVQVHGRAVEVLASGHPARNRMEADALVTDDPARAISVRVADCVPVLLADRGGRAVAAVHAGWRGTLAGVVSATVEALTRWDVRPADLVAAIGPSVGPCCYQVDGVVHEAFRSARPQADTCFSPDGQGTWKLDLWRANVDQLISAGVPPQAIHVARLCTVDHADVCFSFRREGPGGGRMVAAIRRRTRPTGAARPIS